jgi:hypothetical protein
MGPAISSHTFISQDLMGPAISSHTFISQDLMGPAISSHTFISQDLMGPARKVIRNKHKIPTTRRLERNHCTDFSIK